MSTRKLLVTGASGFVGRFLLERLQRENSVSLIGLHHRELEEDANTLSDPDLAWQQADLPHDDLCPLVSGIDTVFHLAAKFSLSEKKSDQQDMQRVNVEGTRRLAEASKAAGVRHFIFASSIAAHEATTSYGKTKKQAEDLLLSMAGNGFNVTILRAASLFGEYHRGSIYELARTIQNGRFAIFGRGDNRVNFYYVRDFVDALVSVSSNQNAYGKVWVAVGTSYTLKELSNTIAELIGHKQKPPHYPIVLGRILAAACDGATSLTGASLPLSTRRFKAMTQDNLITGQNLYQVLGITPHYGLREGLKKTIEYYRAVKLLD